MIVSLRDKPDIEMIVLYAQHKNFQVGITSGCFDLTHFYHLYYLERCRRMCDYLIVGIDSDKLIKETKGDTRPIFSELHRVNLVASYRCVDAVFVMNTSEEFEKAVNLFRADMIFKNQGFIDKKVFGADDSKTIIIPDILEDTSTSAFISKIQGLIDKQ